MPELRRLNAEPPAEPQSWLLVHSTLTDTELWADPPMSGTVRAFRRKYPEGWMWASVDEFVSGRFANTSWWPMEVLLTALRHPAMRNRYAAVEFLG